MESGLGLPNNQRLRVRRLDVALGSGTMARSGFDSCQIEAEAPLSKEIRFLCRGGEEVVSTLLQQALCEFAGPGGHATSDRGHEPQVGGLAAGVVILLNPSRHTRTGLAGQGYTQAHSFFTLPSFASPRWLLPLTDERCARPGLHVYEPFAGKGRVMKGLLAAIVAARCQAVVPHHLLIASRGTLPLEDLVHQVTGEHQPVFALLVGTEARFRKLTVQVMRPEGEILGYIKLPLTDAAAERVRHEADTLIRLWEFPALRPHIPRVLYSGEWGQGTILFQTGGPPRPGPVRLGPEAEEFLQILRAIRAVPKPGRVLWEEVATHWRRAEPGLTSEWRALGHVALGKAKRELEGITITCGVSHGDFVPWNMRLGDDGLFVFDWEAALWEAPAQWDVFHFKTQVAALLRKNHDLYLSPDRRSGDRASFLLYLLSSACRLLGEASASPGAGLEFRRQLLAKQLGGY